jgi:hypothetical protein
MTTTAFVPTQRRISTALWHANAELRARRQSERQHHRNVFCDLIENAEYPRLVLHEVVRRLGRARSLMIEIDPDVINTAVRAPKIFEGRL